MNASLGNEFATVGYRAHSMIHGELEAVGEADDYTTRSSTRSRPRASRSSVDGDEVEFVMPLNLAFGNPDLLRLVGVGAVLHGLGGESEYKNDEMIDNQLRSVLFQIPVAGQRRLPGRPDAARLLQGRASTSARSTSSVAATTACRCTTTCAGPSG